MRVGLSYKEKKRLGNTVTQTLFILPLETQKPSSLFCALQKVFIPKNKQKNKNTLEAIVIALL